MSRCAASGRSSLSVPTGTRQNLTLDLLYRYRRQPSIQIRNRLVELNIGLVRQVAHRLSQRSLVPYEDLEQLGCLGLIRAIERFDPQQGAAFSSFAVPYIRGEMLHYLRDHSNVVRIPRRWQCLQRRGQSITAQLTGQLGRRPSDLEIAEALGISLHEWRRAQLSHLNQVPMSLDAFLSSNPDPEANVTLGDMLPDPRQQEETLQAQDRMQLQRALGQLESQTRQILEFVYIRNFTRKQTADRIGVSPMTITRRVQKGLAQLTALMQD